MGEKKDVLQEIMLELDDRGVLHTSDSNSFVNLIIDIGGAIAGIYCVFWVVAWFVTPD